MDNQPSEKFTDTQFLDWDGLHQWVLNRSHSEDHAKFLSQQLSKHIEEFALSRDYSADIRVVLALTRDHQPTLLDNTPPPDEFWMLAAAFGHKSKLARPGQDDEFLDHHAVGIVIDKVGFIESLVPIELVTFQ